MYCTRKVLDDLIWVGADDRRLVCFEGAYDVPNGVSYNSYLLTDEKTVLFDTVDWSACRQLLENLETMRSAGAGLTTSSSRIWSRITRRRLSCFCSDTRRRA